jgi:hypothetical protein
MRSNQLADRHEGQGGTTENKNEFGFSAIHVIPAEFHQLLIRVGMLTLDNSSGQSWDFEDESK